MLDGNIFITHLLHLRFRLCQSGGEGSGYIRLLIASRDFRQSVNSTFTSGLNLLQIQTELAHQLTNESVFLTKQRIKQVNLLDLSIAIALRKLLCAL